MLCQGQSAWACDPSRSWLTLVLQPIRRVSKISVLVQEEHSSPVTRNSICCPSALWMGSQSEVLPFREGERDYSESFATLTRITVPAINVPCDRPYYGPELLWKALMLWHDLPCLSTEQAVSRAAWTTMGRSLDANYDPAGWSCRHFTKLCKLVYLLGYPWESVFGFALFQETRSKAAGTTTHISIEVVAVAEGLAHVPWCLQ